MAQQIVRSSGDVFRDLGFDATEAHDLRLRSDLMIEIRKRIKALGESQAKIAERFGVTQPRVSDLLRGKIHLFSLDALVKMLGVLGAIVRVDVAPSAAWHDAATWVVCAGVPALIGSDAALATTLAINCSGHSGTAIVTVVASETSFAGQMSSGAVYSPVGDSTKHLAADTQLALAA